MHPDISPSSPLFAGTTGISKRGAGRGGLRWFLSAAMRNWQRRKMIATFNAMDDRILSDIGLRREDIVRTVDSFHEMRRTAQAPVASGQPHSLDDAERPDAVVHDIRRAA